MLDPTEQMMLENLSKNSKNKELIEKFQIVEKNLHELSKLFLPASTSSVSIVATPSAGAMEAEKMLIYENNLKEVLQSVNALKNEYKNYGEYFDRLEEKLSKHQEIIDKLMGTYGSHTLPSSTDSVQCLAGGQERSLGEGSMPPDDLLDIEFIVDFPQQQKIISTTMKKSSSSSSSIGSQSPPPSQETYLYHEHISFLDEK